LEAAAMNASLKPIATGAEAERNARVDLAACYRLAAHFGLNEGIDNHLTLLVPG
jgi:ribulose-5-phosphate 4-epimerase/fuculose-1-phosphate aldolase